MSKILSIATVAVLILHGLIHLMGTVTYLQLSTVDGLAYKTTLLNGRWDVGQPGIAVFGVLWAVTAIGFIVSAAGLIAGRSWTHPMLVGVTLLSLVITALDWNTAFAGAILNVVILIALWLRPLISER